MSALPGTLYKINVTLRLLTFVVYFSSYSVVVRLLVFQMHGGVFSLKDR